MKCPVDETTLVMSERRGIEIDYCPTCRGVWLDRGELDKIIERSAEEDRRPDDDRPRRPERERDDRRHRDDERGGLFGRRRRREGFLSELFDFGD
jgi:Zn-finger nucleic acid-binding protein